MHGRVQKKQGLCLFWGEIEVKKTQAIKRHKVDVRVVPFGGKKGTSLVRKGTSKRVSEWRIERVKGWKNENHGIYT